MQRVHTKILDVVNSCAPFLFKVWDKKVQRCPFFSRKSIYTCVQEFWFCGTQIAGFLRFLVTRHIFFSFDTSKTRCSEYEETVCSDVSLRIYKNRDKRFQKYPFATQKWLGEWSICPAQHEIPNPKFMKIWWWAILQSIEKREWIPRPMLDGHSSWYGCFSSIESKSCNSKY